MPENIQLSEIAFWPDFHKYALCVFLSILMAFFVCETPYIKEKHSVLNLWQDNHCPLLESIPDFQVVFHSTKSVDHPYYNITKSPCSVMGFMSCYTNPYITQRKRQALPRELTIREKCRRFHVSPAFRPWNKFTIFTTCVQCFCSLSADSKCSFPFLMLQSLP